MRLSLSKQGFCCWKSSTNHQTHKILITNIHVRRRLTAKVAVEQRELIEPFPMLVHKFVTLDAKYDRRGKRSVAAGARMNHGVSYFNYFRCLCEISFSFILRRRRSVITYSNLFYVSPIVPTSGFLRQLNSRHDFHVSTHFIGLFKRQHCLALPTS